MDQFVRITKNITFADLRSGKKQDVDAFEEQIKSWLLNPISLLASNSDTCFENGYAMFALELLFFEPHGKYLTGGKLGGSRQNFDKGFKDFLEYAVNNKFLNPDIAKLLESINIYSISRCGIYHTMSIKSGLLIDSINLDDKLIFYKNPVFDGLLVNPWNFSVALENYIYNYIKILRTKSDAQQYQNFSKSFKEFFNY